MKLSQKLALQAAETRRKINAAITKANAAPADEPDEAAETEMRELTADLASLETRQAEAAKAEGAAVESTAARAPAAEDGESRELRSLRAKARFGEFLREAADGREVEGAEREFREARLGRRGTPGFVPIEVLDPGEQRSEQRADAVTPVADAAISDSYRAPVLDRIFKRSIASRLMVSMQTVPTGDAVYPVMTGGTTAEMKAKDAAVDAGAASFTGETLSPVRLTARYLFRVEDMARFPQLEATLRRDVGMAMADQMDEQIINGDGTAPNVTGFLSELPDPTDPGAVLTFATWLETFLDFVDGIRAFGLMDLRCIVGPHTFRKAAATFSAAAGMPEETSAYEYVSSRMGECSVSARIPNPNNNIQRGIVALTQYPGANAVAPVWDSVQLIRDPYTDAAKGRVAITAVMLWNFKIVREGGFRLFEAKVA